MELTHDWRNFQDMFYPSRRTSVPVDSARHGSAYVIVEGDQIVAAFTDGEDLSDWIGATRQELAAHLQHREIRVLKRDEVDRWVNESLERPHFYEQVEYLRAMASSPVRRHFLLEALRGWWEKVLPSTYGIFIRAEGQGGKSDQDLFILVRRGALDAFHEPDLHSMGPERRRQPGDVVKYLSEKHLVPVQGLFVPAAMWEEWSQDPNPWRQIALAIRANKAKLMPFRWTVVTLLGMRGFLGA